MALQTNEPNLEGLEIVQLELDSNDPRLRRAVPLNCWYQYRFSPINEYMYWSGRRMVTVALLPPHYFDYSPTDEEVMGEIERRNMTLPDWAIAVILLEQSKGEVEAKPTVCICRTIKPCALSDPFTYYISSKVACGRCIDLEDLQFKWWSGNQLAAVVNEELLP